MFKLRRGFVSSLLIAFLLTFVLAVPVMAEDTSDTSGDPMVPMLLSGSVVDTDGKALQSGQIILSVGQGAPYPYEIIGGKFRAAIEALSKADVNTPINFVVVVSGKEYAVQPAEAVLYQEAANIVDVLITVDLKSSGSGTGGSGSSGSGSSSVAVIPPTASPPAGSYDAGKDVTLTTGTKGAVIYYTTDGSSPKESATRINYSSPIKINSDTKLKAVAYKDSVYSHDAVFTYTIKNGSTEPTEPTKPNEPTEPTGPTTGLTDLDGHWAAQIIQELVDGKIISGYEDNTFRPDNLIARTECAAILVRALSLNAVNEETLGGFSDAGEVPSWAQSQVDAAIKAGLLKGYPEADGKMTFRPAKQVTRVELATILSRVVTKALGEQQPPEPNFTDLAQIPEWGLEGVGIAAQKALVNGYPDGSFMPQKEVTRAEAAAMIARLLSAI